MSGAETAASLFGDDDPAADLFASLGTEDSLQPGHDTSISPDFPNNTTAPASDVFATQDSQAGVHSSWLETPQSYGNEYISQQPESYQPELSTTAAQLPNSKLQDVATGGTSYAPSQVKRQSYEPQAYAAPATGVQKPTYDPYTPATKYAVPANPPGQSAYASPGKKAYALPPLPPSNPAQSTYSPYAPPTPSYAPSTPTYAPSTPSYAPTTPSATHTSPYSSMGKAPYVSQKVAVVPPPPPPAPVLNRPKLSNAYDPPFPTTRSTKRGASSSSLRSSAYAAYATPTPPPPPPGGQFSSSGYPLPPPLPPPHNPDPGALRASVSPPSWGSTNGTVVANSAYQNLDVNRHPATAPPVPSNPHLYTAGQAQYTDMSNSTIAAGATDPYSHPSVPAALGADTQVARPLPPARTTLSRTSSRSNSILSQASDRSADASLVSPPHSGDVNRTSSPASFSTRSRTATPDPYAPPPTNGSGTAGISPTSSTVDRVPSPASIHSLDETRSPQSLSANPYLPNSTINRERAASPLKRSTTSSFDPPKPTVSNGYNVERSSSPAAFSPLSNGQNTNQYLPPRQVPALPPLPRNRSLSGSVYSTSSSPEQPYAPQHGHGIQQRSETDYGSYTSRYNYKGPAETSTHDYSAPQEITMKPAQPTVTAYAPSPSLLGANDPLGRRSARAPIFSFGFGGKFLTCFHGASMNTGFDVALSSRNSTGIDIRQLNKIIPQSALEVSSASFPGPLFSDPGTPTTGLVRPTVSTQTKTKKTRLIQYLTDRVEEISQGIGYLHSDSVEGRQAEGKLVIVKLLKILVENDGRLSGTPQIDAAVRAALVPKLDVVGASTDTPSLGFTSIADIHRPSDDGISYSASDPSDSPIATSTLRPSALDKIQDFLLRGERRQAYHFALDERLWAHAMVIASGIDRDAWKETVNEFLRTELGAKDNRARGPASLQTTESSLTNGREGLRVAYSLYSGQGSASVQEMVPQNLLSRAAGRLQLPTASHMTPMTPNFAAPPVANNIPPQSLAGWAETAAMMLSSPVTPETSAALTALGDQLLSHQWVEAAHACYLLSPQTSPVGGLGNPAARIVLVGSRSPQVWPSFYKDSDPVIFTEILEFALSLAPPAKGHDAFYGLPHLQAYRFIRAIALAELGEVQVASRYCEAITASFARGSPYFTGALMEQLKALSDRIVGLDHSDKSGFWKSTPSLDTIGRYLEGRFTKLVTGDTDPSTPTEELSSKPVDPKAGPFSQYSTISSAFSSATPSTSPSPQPSMYNLNAHANSGMPPMRSGSAMGQQRSQAPIIDRASSAMEHVRRRPSPPAAPRISSANASTTTFAQAPSFVQAYGNYSPNPYSPSMNTPRPSAEIKESSEEDGGQEVTWWGSSAYGNSDSANQTPMAATFMQVDSGVPASSDGFISLMDNNSYSVSPSKRDATPRPAADEEEDEDDLGFGNSKKKAEAKNEKEGGEAAPADAAAAKPERPDIKPTQAATSSGSWLGRLWRRSDSAPAAKPIKASLGEETSFYYDKEQKRWVNKKAGAEEPKPAAPPPPPPSRPQSAAPGMTRAGTSTPPPPPPARSASAAGDGPPPRKPLRVRSTLAPTPETGAGVGPLPSSPLRSSVTPDSSTTPPPGPPSRPKSQSSKRAIRSRYVDVFQQPEGGAA